MAKVMNKSREAALKPVLDIARDTSVGSAGGVAEGLLNTEAEDSIDNSNDDHSGYIMNTNGKITRRYYG
jgi:hypothetical protein